MRSISATRSVRLRESRAVGLRAAAPSFQSMTCCAPAPNANHAAEAPRAKTTPRMIQTVKASLDVAHSTAATANATATATATNRAVRWRGLCARSTALGVVSVPGCTTSVRALGSKIRRRKATRRCRLSARASAHDGSARRQDSDTDGLGVARGCVGTLLDREPGSR